MAVWSPDDNEYDYLFKIIVIEGGQQSNIHKFLETFFTANDAAVTNGSKATPKTRPTPKGLDYKEKDVDRNGRRIRVQIWDTAGQERFRSVTSTFYRGSHGALLVFSLSKLISFSNLTYWIEEIKEHVPKYAVFLVGTISSGEPPRQVSHNTMLAFAEKHEVEYFESELDNVGVNKIFMSLVDIIVNTLTGTGDSIDAGKSIEDSSVSFSFKLYETNSSISKHKRWCCWK